MSNERDESPACIHGTRVGFCPESDCEAVEWAGLRRELEEAKAEVERLRNVILYAIIRWDGNAKCEALGSVKQRIWGAAADELRLALASGGEAGGGK